MGRNQIKIYMEFYYWVLTFLTHVLDSRIFIIYLFIYLFHLVLRVLLIKIKIIYWLINEMIF